MKRAALACTVVLLAVGSTFGAARSPDVGVDAGTTDGGVFRADAGSVDAGIKWRGPKLPPHDGSVGAVCRWGFHAEEGYGRKLPKPAACAKGLTCCYSGGRPGMASTCRNVRGGGCPNFP